MEPRKYRPIKKSKLFTIVLAIFVGLFVLGYFTNENDRYLNIPELDVDFMNEKNNEIIKNTKNISENSGRETAMISKEVNLAVSENKKETVLISGVPFSSQAPLAEWDDSRQQDGCEEVSSLMAIYWAKEKSLNQKLAKDEILKIADYQEKKYGSYVDTSVFATANRIIKEYFNYKNVKVVYDIEIKDIISELENGNLVIVPTNGQKLYNPYYNPPGPERHNVIVKGFDYYTDEFITNDPGTSRGEDYRYNKNILYNAIRDYPTGDHEMINEIKKAMIVVSK